MNSFSTTFPNSSIVLIAKPLLSEVLAGANIPTSLPESF
jgi:hypothetical protein